MRRFNYEIKYGLAQRLIEKYKHNPRDPKVLAKSSRVEDLPFEHFDLGAFYGRGHRVMSINLSENRVLLIPFTSTVRENIPYIAMPSYRYKKVETGSCSKVDLGVKTAHGCERVELSYNYAPKFGIVYNTDDKRGRLKNVKIDSESELTLEEKFQVFYFNALRETDRVFAYSIEEGKVLSFSKYDIIEYYVSVDQNDHTPESRGYYLVGEDRDFVQDTAFVLGEDKVIDPWMVNGFNGANLYGSILEVESSRKDRYMIGGVKDYEHIKGCPKNLVDSKLTQVDKKSVASGVNYKNGIGRHLSNRPNLVDSLVDDKKFNLINYLPGGDKEF